MLWQSRMAIIVGEREEHSTPRHVTGLEQGQAKHSGENGVNKVKERKIMMRGKQRLSTAVRAFIPPPPPSPPPVSKGIGNGNLEDPSKEDEKGEEGKDVPRRQKEACPFFQGRWIQKGVFHEKISQEGPL